MLKCVMFDFGGTLFHFHDEERNCKLYHKIFNRYGYKISLQNIMKVRKNEHRKRMKETYGDPNQHGKSDELMRRVLKRLGFEVDEKKIRKMIKEYETEREKYFKAYPGVHETLSKLRRRKLKMIIISNGSREWQKRQMEAIDIGKYIDFVITSKEIGYEKSSLVPFETALKKLKLKPEECLMVGDRVDEDMYAKRLGIWTCHAGYGPKLPIVGKKVNPDFKINKVRELLNVIDIVNRSGSHIVSKKV